MVISNAPKGHTSFNFCQALKDNWNDWNAYISASGFKGYTPYLNHIAWEKYQTNRATVIGNRNKPISIDYNNDEYFTARNKTSTYTNGQFLDEYQKICGWRLFHQKEMKKRGMKY